MTISGSTLTRVAAVLDTPLGEDGLDAASLPPLDVPASLLDISCWRLLSARVPLTLLLDLASSEDELDERRAELIGEPSSLDWLVGYKP
jgi:hypothetical protein